MPTITTMLNEAYADKNGLYPIIIRIAHNGLRRRISVGHKIEKKFWLDGQVSRKHPEAAQINAIIDQKTADIKRYLADCDLHGKPIHLDLIGSGRTSYSFTGYLRQRSVQYLAAGKSSIAEKGKIVMSQKVDRYVKELEAVASRQVFFEDVTLDFLRRLDQYLIECGNAENTRHQKFKRLGEFYDQAIAEGKATGSNPFDGYKIPKRDAKKEKLSPAEIAAIESLALKPGAVNDARNLFLFSFYTKGQRFETCVTMRRTQVADGRIMIITNKGKDHMSVKIHARLQAIIEQYQGDGELLFPFLDQLPTDPEDYLSAVGSQNTIFNRNLKTVAALAKIKKRLTFHIARHSFADQLSNLTDSVSIIQAALGHSDEKTTRIYLNALKDERLDPEMEKLYGK
jgi:site-specific recombinase XerD